MRINALNNFLGMKLKKTHASAKKRKEVVRSRREYLELWKMKVRPPIGWDE